MQKLLFWTKAYEYLALEVLEITRQSGVEIEPGNLDRYHFLDGELYLNFKDLEGNAAYIIGSVETLESGMEMLMLIYGAQQVGAEEIHLIIPYYAYSTMERRKYDQPGEVITAQVVAQLYAAEKVKTIHLFDLHSPVIEGLFPTRIKVKHHYCKSLIIDAIRNLVGYADFTLASTDEGRIAWVQSLANELGGIPTAYVKKVRLSGHETKVREVDADVQDRRVVIYDDMVRKGSTVIGASGAYYESGASKIYLVVTHGPLTDQPAVRIKIIQNTALLSAIVMTNSHPNSQLVADCEGVTVISMAPLIVEKVFG